MNNLIDFIQNHAERGACQCGKCIDAPAEPDKYQPTGHTADLVFFKVRTKDEPSADDLRSLIRDQDGGWLFDGNEHGFVEIGGWIGDQSAALMLMGLGEILGLWRLLTPISILGPLVAREMAMRMAEAGLVSVQAVKGDS